jgi:hypothetical protein
MAAAKFFHRCRLFVATFWFGMIDLPWNIDRTKKLLPVSNQGNVAREYTQKNVEMNPVSQLFVRASVNS